MSRLEGLRRSLWHLRKGGVAQWQEHRRRQKRVPTSTGWKRPLIGVDFQGRLLIKPWEPPVVGPRREIVVAVIADDFTATALGYEWDQILVTPDNWRKERAARRPELLFVESAWNGNRGAWQYHLTGTSAPRPAVVDLVRYCRDQGIPTVFWNKEDPSHFEDFLDTARLFDQVFTTDAECVERYQELLGHDRVGVLPFAVQDRTCNPMRIGDDDHSRDVCFAGTYFAHKFPERREQMDLLFPAALAAAGEGFEIFSRFVGGDDRYQFPEPYAAHVVGGLDAQQILAAYRAYKVFLNVNSVVDSPTMFARRVLEITACGTAVVSTPAAGISAMVGDGVAQVGSTREAEQAIRRLLTDDDARQRMVHLGQRELWRAHTYSHRVAQVLEAVGLSASAPKPPTVSAIVATRRPHQLSHVVDYLCAQREVELELVLGANGFEPDPVELARAREAGIHVVVAPQPEGRSLGTTLNDLVAKASGEVVSKMDDDDYYGAWYLFDLLAAMRFSGADVVGKQARYAHFQTTDQAVLLEADRQHVFTTFIAGPTITAAREFVLDVGYQDRSTGEDTAFLRTAMERGGRLYASDKFNFVQVRRGAAGGHTWGMQDEALLGRATTIPVEHWGEAFL